MAGAAAGGAGVAALAAVVPGCLAPSRDVTMAADLRAGCRHGARPSLQRPAPASGGGVNLGDTHAGHSLASGPLRRIARPVFLIQFVSTRTGLLRFRASSHPSRWASLVIAPHPGQTRCAQQAESPPSAGRLSSCPLLTVSSMEVSGTPVAAHRDRSAGDAGDGVLILLFRAEAGLVEPRHRAGRGGDPPGDLQHRKETANPGA